MPIESFHLRAWAMEALCGEGAFTGWLNWDDVSQKEEDCKITEMEDQMEAKGWA